MRSSPPPANWSDAKQLRAFHLEDTRGLGKTQVVADEDADPAEGRLEDWKPAVSPRGEPVDAEEGEMHLPVDPRDRPRTNHGGGVVESARRGVALQHPDDGPAIAIATRLRQQLRRGPGNRLRGAYGILRGLESIPRQRALGEDDEIRLDPRDLPEDHVQVARDVAEQRGELVDGQFHGEMLAHPDRDASSRTLGKGGVVSRFQIPDPSS